jgi:hypothetical protein
MGTSTSTVSIDAEVAGLFKGILIPIPRDFRHDVAFKPDYFAGYTFDAPVTGTFTTGSNVRFSGTTTVSESIELQFRFDPLEAGLDTLKFRSTITNGAFAINVLFPHDRAGTYELNIFNQLVDESFPFVGRVPVATVSPGTGAIDIPADFFTGIQLESPMPTEIEAGEALRVSGSITDPAVTRLLLTFTNPATGEAVVSTSIDVTSGAFDDLIVFSNEQTGSYELTAFAGLAGESLPFVGSFPTFTVTEASGAFTLPTDFFEGFTLNAALPTEFVAGQGFSLSGSVTDTALEEILFRFTAEDGSQIRFQADIDQGIGTFRKGMIFFPTQSGSYTLDVFAGQSGESLPFKGTFSPITVTAGQGSVFLPVDIFDGLILDQPLNSELFQSSSPRLTGTLSDVTHTGIAIRLDSVDGSITGDSEFGSISNGQIDLPIPIDGLGAGDYTLVIFVGQTGESLPFLDSFGPFTLVGAQPRISVSVSSLTFGSTEVGQTASLTVEASNVGSQNLTIDTVVSGPFTGSASATSVSTGGNSIVAVIYAPTNEGLETGTLTILTNDPTQAGFTILLEGTGLAASAPLRRSLSPQAHLRMPKPWLVRLRHSRS